MSALNSACFPQLVRLLVAVLVLPLAVAGVADADSRTSAASAVREYQDGDRGRAIRQMMQLAYQGNIAAQFNLGVINHAREDSAIAREEALYWFGQAAEEGDVGAQFNLGMLLLEVPDFETRQQAIQWLQRSAEAGHIPAMVNLGILGFSDGNVPGGAESGREWLEEASRTGDSVATELLYNLSESPDGTGMLGRMYPLDRELRSEVNRGGSRIIQDDTPVYALPTGRQEPLITLPLGSTVTVLDKKDGWVKVRLGRGLPAWVEEVGIDVQGGRGTVNRLEAGLFVLPGDDRESYRLGTVNKGEQVPVVSRQQGWVQVEAPLRFPGWIRQSSVDLRVRTVRSGVSADGGPVAGMRQLPPSGSQRVVRDTTPALVLGESGVYRQPDPASPVIGHIAAGERVQRGESRNGYSELLDAPVSAWIFASLVAREDDMARVRVDRARLRARPRTDSAIIDLVEAGQRLPVVDEQSGWLRIRLEPQSGWVLSSDLGESFPEDTGSDDAAVPVRTVDTVLTEATASAVPADAILYDGPDTRARPLGRLMDPLSVDQLGESNGRIRLPEIVPIYGWIYHTLVDQSDNASIIRQNGARIRLDPNTTTDNIIRLGGEGETIRILDRANNWFRVELPAGLGWVDLADVDNL